MQLNVLPKIPVTAISQISDKTIQPLIRHSADTSQKYIFDVYQIVTSGRKCYIFLHFSGDDRDKNTAQNSPKTRHCKSKNHFLGNGARPLTRPSPGKEGYVHPHTPARAGSGHRPLPEFQADSRHCDGYAFRLTYSSAHACLQ